MSRTRSASILAAVLALSTALHAQDRAGDDDAAAQTDPWAALAPDGLSSTHPAQESDACGARDAAAGARQSAAPARQPAPQPQQPLRRGGVRSDESASDKRTASSNSSWTRTLASLAAVIALILLLAWGYRVTAGRMSGAQLLSGARRNGVIEIVSRTALSARHGLALVRVGPRLVLVGVSHDGLRALDVLDDPAAVADVAGQAAAKRGQSHTAEFAQMVERESATFRSVQPSAAPPGSAPDDAQLGRVRRAIHDALQRVQAAGSA